MSHAIRSKGFALAALLALAWPVACLSTSEESARNHRHALLDWSDTRRHVEQDPLPHAPSQQTIQAFRMGLDSDSPLFPRRNAP
ncbi:hypothetical protein SIID45300_00466 [Candidatus Magnetaquicoccaceae bacterium FCR-1]|uniref:Secreted protein n=1 Tax=Candidatus Magnetaquiglobus chichijimensis TaxID=3141448 RepID=A0ABQ0C5J0_9PROT